MLTRSSYLFRPVFVNLRSNFVFDLQFYSNLNKYTTTIETGKKILMIDKYAISIAGSADRSNGNHICIYDIKNL